MRHHRYEGKTFAKILIILEKKKKKNGKNKRKKNFLQLNTLLLQKKAVYIGIRFQIDYLDIPETSPNYASGSIMVFENNTDGKTAQVQNHQLELPTAQNMDDQNGERLLQTYSN